MKAARLRPDLVFLPYALVCRVWWGPAWWPAVNVAIEGRVQTEEELQVES